MPAEQEARTVPEAVGIFHRSEDLQGAIDELLSSGFHRAALSLLASDRAVDEKLGHRYEKVRALADDPTVPRSAYVSTEAIGGIEGGLIGGLMYIGAAVAAGAVVASGGTLAAVIAATALAGSLAQFWPNGSAIAMRIICKSKSTGEASYYGCGHAMPRMKNAPSRFLGNIQVAMSTFTHCRQSRKMRGTGVRLLFCLISLGHVVAGRVSE